MREAREALLLVALQHADPGCGTRPEDSDRHDQNEAAEHREMLPRRTRHEQHRSQRRHIDECRAEVGLREDERHRKEAEPDDAHGRVPRTDRPLALGEHAGEREDEEELPELRRLEGEEAEADPARRATRRVADQEDERDHRRRADEDRAPVAAVQIRIDKRRDHEGHSSGGRVEDLAVEVVGRVVRHRELRHPGDTPEADEHERAHARQEDPVDGAHDAEEMRSLALVAQTRSLRSGVLEHQSEWMSPCWADGTWKKCAKTRSAAGAAAVPPWPPFSITTHTTSFGAFTGP